MFDESGAPVASAKVPSVVGTTGPRTVDDVLSSVGFIAEPPKVAAAAEALLR